MSTQQCIALVPILNIDSPALLLENGTRILGAPISEASSVSDEALRLIRENFSTPKTDSEILDSITYIGRIDAHSARHPVYDCILYTVSPKTEALKSDTRLVPIELNAIVNDDLNSPDSSFILAFCFRLLSFLKTLDDYSWQNPLSTNSQNSTIYWTRKRRARLT